MGWRTIDGQAARATAVARGARAVDGELERGGIPTPAVAGIGDSLLYLVDDGDTWAALDRAAGVAHRAREAEADEQIVERGRIGRRDLDEGDAAQAARVGGRGGHRVGSSAARGCQLFQ